MLHRKVFAVAFAIFAWILLAEGCYKSSTVYVGGADLSKEQSFTNDILPIFEKRCALSGCHITGGQVPDLTAANAYNALLQEDLINFDNPESSELYDWLTGKLTPAMPLGGSDPDINAVVLAWLEQGAKNN